MDIQKNKGNSQNFWNLKTEKIQLRDYFDGLITINSTQSSCCDNNSMITLFSSTLGDFLAVLLQSLMVNFIIDP